jgi:transposase
VAAIIELDNAQWALVEDLFDPPGRCGVPATYLRREMVDGILSLARTGCQWRYLPEHFPPWPRCGSSGGAGARAACGPGR